MKLVNVDAYIDHGFDKMTLERQLEWLMTWGYEWLPEEEQKILRDSGAIELYKEFLHDLETFIRKGSID